MRTCTNCADESNEAKNEALLAGQAYAQNEGHATDKPGIRRYNQRGGRPPLDVDFVAVYDAVQEAWNGSGESITDIAERFGVSRGWIYKWVYPAVEEDRGTGSEPR